MSNYEQENFEDDSQFSFPGEPVVHFDSATGDVRAEDKELLNAIVESFYDTSIVGSEYKAKYHCPENNKKIIQALQALGQPVSVSSLATVVAQLMANGGFIEPPEQLSEEQIREASRTEWNRLNGEWMNSHTTAEVKERIKKGDKAFESWLREHSTYNPTQNPELFQVKVLTNYGDNPTITADYMPGTIKAVEQERKEIRKQDKKYLSISDELRSFAAEYAKTPTATVKVKMQDPRYREQVEAAAEAGLIL